MSKYKRKYCRFLLVDCVFRYKYTHKIVNCQILDLSHGGALLKIPQVFLKGDVITIFLKDNFGVEMPIKAEVKYSTFNKIGIKFLEDSLLVSDFISDIIKNYKDSDFSRIMRHEKLYK